MKTFVRCLPLGLALACCAPVSGQMLVVDRAMPSGGVWLGRAEAPGFVADHFKIGAPGEVWIVDAIRTWASADRNGSPVRLNDVFEKVTLFGGIEATPPDPTQPPQPECDCHNLMAIKSGSLSAGGSDVRVSSATSGGWQLDFQNIHWSIPGGVPIQFGVMGVARTSAVWFNHAAQAADAHELKAFDEKGKLDGPYTEAHTRIGISIQVWAHKTAPVTIRSTSKSIEVMLRSDKSFDATKADPASLRFGVRQVGSIGTRLETVEGQAALVACFRNADEGNQGKTVSLCMTGRLQDGVPFEGCDAVTFK
jgi:hypothetical protein